MDCKLESITMDHPLLEKLPPQLGNYVLQEILGYGTFGIVVRCLNTRTGEIVALKIFENNSEDMERELGILQHLSNSIDPDKVNIIKCFEHFRHEDYECIAYEVLDRSFYDFIRERQRPFALSELRPITQQLLVAFEALTEAHVVHADMKLDNIMLVNHKDQPYKVKLIDFGCGGFFSELEQGIRIMTDGYRAPEVTLGAPLSGALDMWTLGCCLVEGFLHCQPFSNMSDYDNLRTIIRLVEQPSNEMLNRSLYAEKCFLESRSQWSLKTPFEYQASNWKKPDIGVSPLDDAPNLEAAIMYGHENMDEDVQSDLTAFMDLLKNLLQTDPEKRITPSEALRHPFITMEHLVNVDTEYVTIARELMSVTLNTSASALTENKENVNADQPPQLSAAVAERSGPSFGNHIEISPEEKVNEAPPELKDCIGIEEKVILPKDVVICPEHDEEQLNSCSIEVDQKTQIDKEPEHVLEHVEIEIADYSEDDTNEPSNSTSCWSAVRTLCFGGALVLQAATCFALTHSPLITGAVVLPMMIYGGIEYLTSKRTAAETSTSSTSK